MQINKKNSSRIIKINYFNWLESTLVANRFIEICCSYDMFISVSTSSCSYHVISRLSAASNNSYNVKYF